MATLSELTVQIISARLAKKDMSLEELQNEMISVSNMIKSIDDGTLQSARQVSETSENIVPVDYKKSIKPNSITCLKCNKSFKALKRHLNQAHGISESEYKDEFKIPAKQSLVAKTYSEEKRQMAIKNKLGEKMQAGKKAKVKAASAS